MIANRKVKAIKDKKGRWLPGVSGNPRGRPKGAKDKQKRRIPSRTWDRAANLGLYAIAGGPGNSRYGGTFTPEITLLVVIERIRERIEKDPSTYPPWEENLLYRLAEKALSRPQKNVRKNP